MVLRPPQETEGEGQAHQGHPREEHSSEVVLRKDCGSLRETSCCYDLGMWWSGHGQVQPRWR